MSLAVDTFVSVALCSVRQCVSQSEVDWIPVFVTYVTSHPINTSTGVPFSYNDSATELLQTRAHINSSYSVALGT
jgi:hypothetical protein